jgi:hypothetical protein
MAGMWGCHDTIFGRDEKREMSQISKSIQGMTNECQMTQIAPCKYNSR